MFSSIEGKNNKLYSLQDYLLKEKRSKSVFSLSKTVKRLFFLDFSLQSFYYKNSSTDTDCKTVAAFKVIQIAIKCIIVILGLERDIRI